MSQLVTEWLCVLLDVAGMSLPFIMGFPVETEKYWFVVGALVISGIFNAVEVIHIQEGYVQTRCAEKCYGISLTFFTVTTVFCDGFSLFFFSPCSSSMCECIQPLKWRLQKKERKENQLGTPVIVPFPSQIYKSCVWSQPLDKCTHNIVGK